jgi:hypothetical protein
MSSRYKLWSSKSYQAKVMGKDCQFYGNWQGVADLVAASFWEGEGLGLEMYSMEDGRPQSFASSVLKANIKKNDKSPDFFGYIQVTDSIKLKVWVWKDLTTSSEQYLSCSIEEIQSKNGTEEGEMDGDSSPTWVADKLLQVSIQRKQATLLAALRLWERSGLGSNVHEMKIATDSGRFEALSAKELDTLREELNGIYSEAKVSISLRNGCVDSVFTDRNIKIVVNNISNK